MRKAVKCRFVDSVFIQVSGPKSLLPEPVTETGRMSMTWIHFLNGICGLQLEPTSDYFICNSTYTPTSEGGWTANLNDTIKPFIDKFSRKRSLYCVRLHTGRVPVSSDANATSSTSTAIPDAHPSENDNDTTQPWMSTSLGNPAPKLKTTPVKKFASTVPLKPSQWASSQTPSGSKSSLSSGNVVELPTPVVRIPIRGCPAGTSSSPQQSVTADQLFQKADGKGKPQKSRRNPVSGSSNKRNNNKYIPEFTICIASARSKNSVVSVVEPSPPKLSRFDEVVQTIGIPTAESQPGPSNPTTKAALFSSPRSSSRQSSKIRSEVEKDGSMKNTSGCSTLVAVKREPIEIDLVELDESDEEEEQEGNGYDPQAFLQNERNILGILGILGDNGEDDDDDIPSTLRKPEPSFGQIDNDLVSRFERKLDAFDDSMLLKIKQEIQKLMRNKMWERNVKRSPMACYLLQELFKD